MLGRQRIAVIGGTGAMGSGLTRLLAAAGHSVTIGSRSKEKAEAFANQLSAEGPAVQGDGHRGAANAGDIIILSVPYPVHDAIVEEIRSELPGKILVDVVVPLVWPNLSTVQLPVAGSPAVVAQQVLGPDVRVVAAFQNVGAPQFRNGNRADCDVLVFSDDPMARERIILLAGDVATRGIDGGSLANCVAAEALTSVLIGINRYYRIPAAGIRFTGLPAADPAGNVAAT